MDKNTQFLVALKSVAELEAHRTAEHRLSYNYGVQDRESMVECFSKTRDRGMLSYPLYPEGHPGHDTYFVINGTMYAYYSQFQDKGDAIDYVLELP